MIMNYIYSISNSLNININTVKLAWAATYIKKPPVINDHSQHFPKYHLY